MNFDEYIKSVEGKKIDVDGVPKSNPYQCVDLIKHGMKQMLGIPYFSINNDAANYFLQFENFPQLTENFTKIKNSGTFKPKRGDICVWNKNVGGGHGHVAWASGEGVAEGKSSDYFYSYDQNWSGSSVHKQWHNFTNFLGVLRPKKQNLFSEKKTDPNVYPKYEGKSKSIVDALDEMCILSSFSNRKNIAKVNGISNYIGTASQDTELLILLKRGNCLRP